MPILPKPTAIERHYTTHEVAALTGDSPLSTVHHWIQTGALKTTKPGRRHLIAASELARFLGTPREATPASADARARVLAALERGRQTMAARRAERREKRAA